MMEKVKSVAVENIEFEYPKMSKILANFGFCGLSESYVRTGVDDFPPKSLNHLKDIVKQYLHRRVQSNSHEDIFKVSSVNFFNSF